MKSLNIKLALSALAIALIASPALAARSHQQVPDRPQYSTNNLVQRGEVYTYPKGATFAGTAESRASGAGFNLLANPSTNALRSPGRRPGLLIFPASTCAPTRAAWTKFAFSLLLG